MLKLKTKNKYSVRNLKDIIVEEKFIQNNCIYKDGVTPSMSYISIFWKRGSRLL